GDRSLGHHRCRGAAGAEGGVMHVAFGMLGFAAVLAATVLLEQREAAFSGLFYRPALLLLCARPLFISLISHKLEETVACARSIDGARPALHLVRPGAREWRLPASGAPRARARGGHAGGGATALPRSHPRRRREATGGRPRALRNRRFGKSPSRRSGVGVADVL